MREAVGTTWIFQLVIIFTLIFVSFLALSINYSRAFRIKNEILTIMEKYEGVGDQEGHSVSIINNYLRNNAYGVKGACREGEYGALSLNDNILEYVSAGGSNNRYYYCVKPIPTYTVAKQNQFRFNIRVFFKFNLPVIGELMTFSIDGTTMDIVNANTSALN